MSYGHALQALAGGQSKMGTPPPIPEVAPPPYDVANDPAWKGHVDPNDHAWRNFLNSLDADQRDLVRNKLQGGAAPALGAALGALAGGPQAAGAMPGAAAPPKV